MCSQLRSPQRPSLQALQFPPQAQPPSSPDPQRPSLQGHQFLPQAHPTSRQSPSSADQAPRQNQVPVFCTQLPKLQTQLPSPTGGHHFQFLCPLVPQFLTPQLPSSYPRCISAPQLPNTLLLAIPPLQPPPNPSRQGAVAREVEQARPAGGASVLRFLQLRNFPPPELLSCSTIS